VAHTDPRVVQVVHVEHNWGLRPLHQRQRVRVMTVNQVHISHLRQHRPSEPAQAQPGAKGASIRGLPDPMPDDPHPFDDLLTNQRLISIEGVDSDLVARFDQPARLAQHARVRRAAIRNHSRDASHGSPRWPPL